MTNLLIKDCPLGRSHKLAYPTETIRVEGMWGNGRLIYVTDDGFCGVQLDGETRIDEYPAEHLGIEDFAAEALAALAA